MNESRFGLILLENPFIRNEDVERCLQIQALGGYRKPIGQILLEEGVISERTLDLVLSIQERRRAQLGLPETATRYEDETVPPIMDLLDRARRNGATDVLLALARRPRARISGRIEALCEVRVDDAWMTSFLDTVLDAAGRASLDADRQTMARLVEPQGGTCRVMVFHDSYGPAASIRLVPGTIPTLSELGHVDRVRQMLSNRRGLVLVGGSPRSGRSTTIAAMVNQLLEDGAGHIVVLDEFHEYAFGTTGGLVTRKTVAHDPCAIAAGLRASFREDPDVIVVGNLRGGDSIELCMQLASTGHLVIAGLQASSSVAALQRLEDGVPEHVRSHFRGNLASELAGIVYQDLVPSANSSDLLLVEEVIVPTNAFRWALSQGRFERIPLLLSFESEDSVSLDEQLMALVESGDIAIEEAFARANDRYRFLMTAG